METPRPNFATLIGVALIAALTLFLIHKQNASNAKALPFGTGSSNTREILQEASSAEESQNPFWWLDSGGTLTLQNGVGKTNFGELPKNDYWRKAYAKANPTDTDGGYHPQNIFRLIARGDWHNFTQEAYFNIETYRTSKSSERMGANGFFLLSRYEDEQSLYYSGIRVDGTAVVKKKLAGTYYTLNQAKIFPGTYNRESNPNLLPIHKWIGLRNTITTDRMGIVHLTLYMDLGKTGEWTQILTATDGGPGVETIDSTAHAGIRTDFMDVSFADYKAKEI